MKNFNFHSASNVKDKDCIPLDKNQITYINSGTWNEDKSFRVPFIENARRAYRQLTMIEDSIIIYRLVRAPERLVFNVDVGNMSTPKAESYMRKLMQNYWSKKTFNLDEDKRVNTFNPQSILDAFWFPKREGSEGTNVTTLPGGQNLGELQDVRHISINALQDENSWIFMPEQIQIWISEDGLNYLDLIELKPITPISKEGTQIESFEWDGNIKAKFVKVLAKNRINCPKGHKSEGNPCWIFLDEITIR